MSDCGRTLPSDDELDTAWLSQAELPAELQDVAFPYGAACGAIAVCRRVADRLDNDLTVRVGMVDSLKEWTGGYREEFDTEWCGVASTEAPNAEPTLGSLAGQLAMLKDALRLLAGDCEDAWDEADGINAQRQTARDNADFDPRDADPYSGAHHEGVGQVSTGLAVVELAISDRTSDLIYSTRLLPEICWALQ